MEERGNFVNMLRAEELSAPERRVRGVKPMSAEKLVGNWTLVSWQVVSDGAVTEPFGVRPKGHLILTREGRSIAITTAAVRAAGESQAARAALHRSMLAYTGKYRVEGDEFITKVDVSWNEGWNGTEQQRRFRLEGDTLFIESAPAPSITSPGKTDFRRMVWRRER